MACHIPPLRKAKKESVITHPYPILSLIPHFILNWKWDGIEDG